MSTKGKCREAGPQTGDPTAEAFAAGSRVTGRRRTFCSGCVHEWRLRTIRILAAAGARRDRGVCAVCELDAVSFTAGYSGFRAEAQVLSNQLGVSAATGFWDADILAVAEGGSVIYPTSGLCASGATRQRDRHRLRDIKRADQKRRKTPFRDWHRDRNRNFRTLCLPVCQLHKIRWFTREPPSLR
jgi:hypothetical protein